MATPPASPSLSLVSAAPLARSSRVHSLSLSLSRSRSLFEPLRVLMRSSRCARSLSLAKRTHRRRWRSSACGTRWTSSPLLPRTPSRRANAATRSSRRFGSRWNAYRPNSSAYVRLSFLPWVSRLAPGGAWPFEPPADAPTLTWTGARVADAAAPTPQATEAAAVDKAEFLHEMDAQKRLVLLYEAEIQEGRARATQAEGVRRRAMQCVSHCDATLTRRTKPARPTCACVRGPQTRWCSTAAA